MKFKVGDYVKFKNFDGLDGLGSKYKRGTAGDFHIHHQGRKSKVKELDSHGKLRLEIDKENMFFFKPERFIKSHGIVEMDEHLFQL